MQRAGPTADVVVIGGGVIGCAIAVHLLDAGAGDVLVLERDGIAQATSAAGAGFLGEWAAGWDPRGGDEELAIDRYGLAYYAALNERGCELEYRHNGNLYLATSAKTWEQHCAHLFSRVQDAQRLSPREVSELTSGVVAEEPLFGGVLHPAGAQVSAAAATRVLAAQIADAGGRLTTRLPAERIVVEHERVTGVETRDGVIHTARVVLAAGAWANVLLRPLGVFLPVAPLIAMRVVTEPLGVPGTMPTLMAGEVPFYAREEHGALLWSGGFRGPMRRRFVDVDPPERFDQLPLDGYFEISRHAEAAARLIPRLAEARSATPAYGAPTYTPDGRPLLGPVPGIDGLFAVSGCNEGGVTRGPGLARLAAELICDGSTSLCSIAPFALDRFGDRFATARDVAAVSSY
jgi:glycine/D-amino acid oxidase-like deaminating enzyme